MVIVITDRQHKFHWFFSHLADVLLLILVVGFIIYSLLAWGPL